MAGLTQPAYGLDPAEDLFDPFALVLTDRVPRMASGALVNDTGLFAREMWRDPMLAHFLNQLFAVIAFVGTQGDPMPARNLLYHRQRRLWFGPSGSLSYAAVDRQPMAILHQHMPGVAELRLLAFALARQQRRQESLGHLALQQPVVNTVTSHTGSSIFSPTNHRNRKL